MASSQPQLFVIVGRNEPLFEAELHGKKGSQFSDAVTRQNYFVLHSALDLVEKAAWTTSNMYLRVVDKVRAQQFLIDDLALLACSCEGSRVMPSCSYNTNPHPKHQQ